MPRETVPRPASEEDGDCAETDRTVDTALGERQSVSDLVRNYSDPASEGQKRGRSESGDAAPAGKRGARELGGEPGRSPSVLSGKNYRDYLDAAIDGLESRMMASLSQNLHEFRETLSAEIARLNDRLTDLERHVEERDATILELTDELRQSKSEVSALQTRIEDAEMNSRLPCLVLSGAAMSPRRAPRLEPPLLGRAASGRPRPVESPVPAGPGQGRTEGTSRPADRRDEAGSGQSAPGADGGRFGAGTARSGDWEGREDVNSLVVNTLNQCMPGLNLNASDIDRAHRLPGPNNRVIVRFVRSGEGSIRDMVMSRRLELRGKDLFVNESLTKLRSLIFRSLLAAKRDKKLYTVYSRGGHVFFKEKQHGVGKRVDSLECMRKLGFRELER